jgi:hypothetical protein
MQSVAPYPGYEYTCDCCCGSGVLINQPDLQEPLSVEFCFVCRKYSSNLEAHAALLRMVGYPVPLADALDKRAKELQSSKVLSSEIKSVATEFSKFWRT